MAILSSIVLALAILVAIFFSLIVLITGKGDAMGGGSSVRTTYKGKATFDDIMSQMALYSGIAFMGLVLLYNVVSEKVQAQEAMPSAPITAPANNVPAVNTPVTNTPAANTSASNTPSSNSTASTSSATTPSTNSPAAANNK